MGSIRATVQDTSTAPVCGYDDYDPWGYILAGRSVNSVCGPTSMATRNKFTGKEWDDDLGVNWYHFDWREYDPQIGRWMVRDPLAEAFPEWTPYHYVHNNPIRLVDPAGLDTTVYFFDQAKQPKDDYQTAQYTAVVDIDADGTVYGPYSGSTYPDSEKDISTTTHNTVEEGSHDINNVHGHKGGRQKGLNLVKDKNESTQENRQGLPGIDPQGQKTPVEYINIHTGYNTRRFSEACPTICPADWNTFTSHFDWSGAGGTTGTSKGTVMIYRGTSVGSFLPKSYLQVKQYFQDRF